MPFPYNRPLGPELHEEPRRAVFLNLRRLRELETEKPELAFRVGVRKISLRIE